MSKSKCTEVVEIWKDVVGFEGLYQVSNRGRIMSLTRFVIRTDGRKQPVKGRLLNPAWNGRYYHVMLAKNLKESCNLLHRLVLTAFVGPCPEGMECRHLNGDSSDNSLENLVWDTRDENVQDKIRHGTNKGLPPGEGHWNVKLTEDEVRSIRRSRASNTALAKVFVVSEATIRDIRKRKSWRHI